MVRHPEPAVRQQALLRIARLQQKEYITAVRDLLDHDPDEPVKATALQVWCAVAQPDTIANEILGYLEGAPRVIRMGGIVGLMRHERDVFG
ncbi:MAG: HEAT repeat domain-containing protein [Anaerolineales bacterium]|nr:HEAT repeat domain-containing protein [Anaerolineales bacterium]